MSEFFQQESKWGDDGVKVGEVYDALKNVDSNDEITYLTLDEKQKFEEGLKSFAEQATNYIDENGTDDKEVAKMVAEFNNSTREYVNAYLTSIGTDFQDLNARLNIILKRPIGDNLVGAGIKNLENAYNTEGRMRKAGL
ncbi:MAG: hypothetical protein PHH06_00285 [Candidatus Gracilibacteria bacterium]|nr:hypothetical protein [Candidatus Gracilibacteria bacterium]